MFRFTMPNLTVRHIAGRITIGRPGPPEPPRPETVAELTARRRQLSEALVRSARGNSMIWGTPESIEAEMATLDARIDKMMEAAS